eukprot:TRINITY_DN6691_c0_g1_i3.p1 TRINITY_DN6691_c0_g1~~TRINITY_DN6691_c0_g1_i3.p1  ORF type:complete len:467 (-),score=84.12 TRINITY_DN6691_c0_g1_i3:38-1438(-)
MERMDWKYWDAKMTEFKHAIRGKSPYIHFYNRREYHRAASNHIGRDAMLGKQCQDAHERGASRHHNLEVVAYLRREGLSSLLREHPINALRHSQHKNIVHITAKSVHEYDPDNDIVLHSRGLILDQARNWTVLAYPGPKIFNYNERHPLCRPLDWTSAQVHERLDGLQASLYYYDGKWELSSAWEVDAPSLVMGWKDVKLVPKTFSELFWTTWAARKYCLPNRTDMCYTFEMLSSRYCRMVTGYERKDDIILVSAFIITDDKVTEVSPQSVAIDNGWPPLNTFAFTCEEEVVQALQIRVEDNRINDRYANPFKFGGFVVSDATGHRVKYKSRELVALACQSTKVDRTPPPILTPDLDDKQYQELIRCGDAAEFCAYFPERQAHIEALRSELNQEVEAIQEKFELVKDLPDNLLAGAISKQYYTFILFEVKKKGFDSVWDYFFTMTFEEFEHALRKLRSRRGALEKK